MGLVISSRPLFFCNYFRMRNSWSTSGGSKLSSVLLWINFLRRKSEKINQKMVDKTKTAFNTARQCKILGHQAKHINFHSVKGCLISGRFFSIWSQFKTSQWNPYPLTFFIFEFFKFVAFGTARADLKLSKVEKLKDNDFVRKFKVGTKFKICTSSFQDCTTFDWVKNICSDKNGM